MNTTDNNSRTQTPEDMIELGAASVETHGVMNGETEILGAFPITGIAED